MPRPRPPYLHRQITRHGKPVWYVRRGKGLRIRLHAAFGEFAAEYQAAIAGAATATPSPIKAGAGTLAWLTMADRDARATGV